MQIQHVQLMAVATSKFICNRHAKWVFMKNHAMLTKKVKLDKYHCYKIKYILNMPILH